MSNDVDPMKAGGAEQGRNAAITGWGYYVPEKVLTNEALEEMVDTDDEWIRLRTGIRERRLVGPEDLPHELPYATAVSVTFAGGLVGVQS